MKLAALCLGAISFVVAHVLNVSILAHVYSDPSTEVSPVVDVILEFSFWLVFVIPGIVAAVFASKQRVLHGLAAGLIAGALSITFVLTYTLPGESINVLSAARIIALAVVLSTVGSLVVNVLNCRLRR
ncbi:MAG: hypothetical protein AAFX44_19310 [Pseudomonadota bacterium]